MKTIPYSRDAFDLLHEGSIALAEVECNGMGIDTVQLDRAIDETNQKLSQITKELQQEEVYARWKKKYGEDTNLNSPKQLADLLFNVMKIKPPKFTENSKNTDDKRAATDEDTLETINHPFTNKYLKFRKLNKANNTYLKGIKREVVDGRIHCFFNLGNVKTYRSSASDINTTNIPIRDPEIGPLIRQCFIPTKGRHLVEVDFGGAEVITGVAYHQDPVMIRYLTETDSKGKLINDMHRDSAMELFKLPIEEVSKPIRQIAKNRFVFREFYGGFYVQCANDVWKDIEDVRTVSGMLVRNHLYSEGINEVGELDPKMKPKPGSFEKLCQAAEQNLWSRFSTYAQWRRDVYEQYRRDGWMRSLTGFVYQGYMRRNEIWSYAIQGSSFHCLLWCLIKLVRSYLKKYRMKSIIINEVHDSMLAEVVPSELPQFVEICRYVMVDLLSKQCPWLVLPMKIEVDVAPVDSPWSAKESYKG